MRALMLSMAFVVQITVRMSWSNCRNGANSAQWLVHSRPFARVAFLPLLAELGEPVQCRLLRGSGVHRFEVLRDRRPVLSGRIAEAVAQQVKDTRLHDPGLPRSGGSR